MILTPKLPGRRMAQRIGCTDDFDTGTTNMVVPVHEAEQGDTAPLAGTLEAAEKVLTTVDLSPSLGLAPRTRQYAEAPPDIVCGLNPRALKRALTGAGMPKMGAARTAVAFSASHGKIRRRHRRCASPVRSWLDGNCRD
jgi:hypothetical protein